MRKFPLKPAAFAAMLLVGVSLCLATAQAQTVADQEFVRYGDFFPEASFPMSSIEKQLFADIQEILERMYSGGPSSRYFMPNATKSSLLSVHLSKNNNLLINMSKLVLPRDEFLDDDPFYFGITMLISKKVEERLGIVRPNEITDFSRPPQIYFVFEGRTARPDDYRSDEWLKANRAIRKSQLQPRHRRQIPDELVFISAGHGIYKNLDPNVSWTFQRDPWGPPNEVQEDTTTPIFASRLRGLLASRSSAIVRFARDHGNTNSHPPSGKMWWEMAARYYVKRLLPESPDIWQNYPRTEPIPIDVEQKAAGRQSR